MKQRRHDPMTVLCEWVDGPKGESPRCDSWFWNRLITFVYWTTNAEPWQYYFGAPKAGYLGRVDWYYMGNPIQTYCKTVWCRLHGHAGQVYFNAGGLEPDESCRNCGEGC